MIVSSVHISYRIVSYFSNTMSRDLLALYRLLLIRPSMLSWRLLLSLIWEITANRQTGTSAAIRNLKDILVLNVLSRFISLLS